MHWGKELIRRFLWLSGNDQRTLFPPKPLPNQEDARNHHPNTTLVLAESWGGWSRRNTTTEHVCHPPSAAGSLALNTSFQFGCLLLSPTEHLCRGPSWCSMPNSSWAESWIPPELPPWHCRQGLVLHGEVGDEGCLRYLHFKGGLSGLIGSVDNSAGDDSVSKSWCDLAVHMEAVDFNIRLEKR